MVATLVDYPDRPCPVCKRPMTGRQKTGCSDRCRAEASRRRRRGEVLEAVDELGRGVEKLRRILGDPAEHSS